MSQYSRVSQQINIKPLLKDLAGQGILWEWATKPSVSHMCLLVGWVLFPDFDIEQKIYPGQTNSSTNFLKTPLAKRIQAQWKFIFWSKTVSAKKIPSYRSQTRHFWGLSLKADALTGKWCSLPNLRLSRVFGSLSNLADGKPMTNIWSTQHLE